MVLGQSVSFAEGVLAPAQESPDSYFFEAGGAFGVVDVLMGHGLQFRSGLYLLFVSLTIIQRSLFGGRVLLLRFEADRAQTVELRIGVKLVTVLAKSGLLRHLMFLGPRIHY